MAVRIPAALALLVVLAPSTAADAAFETGTHLADGSLYVRITGAPLLSAGTPLRLDVRTDALERVEARFLPPSGPPGAWMALDGGTAVVGFPQPGAWRLELRAGTAVAGFDLRVWPRADAWIVPASEEAARGVVVQGREAALAWRLVDADGAPLPAPRDARARVEGPGGEEVLPLVPQDGRLVLERAWPPGEHRLHLASAEAGLPDGARPAVGLLVVPPDQADVYGLEEERAVPGAALAVVALAGLGAAVARRRG